jgi:competence protein ComFC
MTQLKFIQQSLHLLRYSFIPNKCPICNKIQPVDFNGEICSSCVDKLTRISDDSCLRCGAGVDSCNCKKYHIEYDALVAPFYYENIAVKIISLFKYRDLKYLSKFFAKEMAQKVEAKYSDVEFDYITYIPFSARQSRTRAYNQSEYLANELSKLLNLPVEKLIIKAFDNKKQHDMKNRNRKGNVAGVYQVDINMDLIGKKILLVDDVKTTGATLNECAKELKLYGAEKVCCVTAVVTNKKRSAEK